MKSPFVQFSRLVRSPLTLATVSLCTIWGCRQLPTSQRDCHREDVAVVSLPSASNEPLPRVNAEYVDPPVPPTEEVAEPKAVKLPIRTLPDVDVFLPEPLPKVPVSSQRHPATPPSSAIEPLPEFVEDEPTTAPPEKPSLLPDTLKVAPTNEPTNESTTTDSSTEQPPETAAPPTTLAVPAEPSPVNERSARNTQSAKTRPSEGTVIDSVESLFERTSDSKSVNTMLSLDSYCDGIVFDSQGFGYVSHRNRIVRFSPTGQASVWATLNNPKGHRIEPEGTHLVCDTERRAVVRLSFNGKVIGVAAKECEGVPLRAPSDLAIDPRGGFYFTDPGYVQIKTPIGRLHYVDGSGKVSRLAGQIGYPTGVAFDASRQRLYVAESQLNRILVFQLPQPGQIESHGVFVQMPKSTSVDYHLIGLCLDGEGNLYVTQHQQKSVQMFDSSGRLLSRFATGQIHPTSVALRSPESRELILTGQVDTRGGQGKVMRLQFGE